MRKQGQSGEVRESEEKGEYNSRVNISLHILRVPVKHILMKQTEAIPVIGEIEQNQVVLPLFS